MEDNVDPRWRKSSFSGNGGGDCVEVAGQASRVLVRDTKQDGVGPALRFTPAVWRGFADQVKRSLASDSPPRVRRPLAVYADGQGNRTGEARILR